MAVTIKEQEVFSFSSTTVQSTCDDTEVNTEKVDSLLAFANRYLNKPYCYGSKPPKCFDCSGFVQFCFSQFNVQLPHSSHSSAFLGKFVSVEHARKGDLIFFTGRNHASETVGHVGIVTELKDDKIYFIHASVQAGVIISNTEEDYYKKRFMMVKRFKL
ncbi:MAG: C40 family peptidase [bacterium]|nr:C40 family peptidase [bacterium]